MAFRSLEAFVEALRKAGELHVVSERVDPRLEISEITNRVVKAGGPALLFTDVKGSQFPVLTNQFGTARRMAMALGASSLDEVAARIAALTAMRPPSGSIVDKIGGALAFAPLANAIPKTVGAGSVHDVVIERPDLTKLPVLTTWPRDAGPFITLPLVITKDPRSGRTNVGMYRMQVYGATETGMHWQRHKHGRAHADAWGTRVPVAVAIGTDPVLTYAATAPLPPLLDEFAFAGLLRRKPVELTPAKTVRPARAGRRGVRARRLRSTTKTSESKARSAITRAFTAWRTAIRRFTLRALRTVANRSTPRPSSASRRWKTPGWAKPPNESSCRC